MLKAMIPYWGNIEAKSQKPLNKRQHREGKSLPVEARCITAVAKGTLAAVIHDDRK